MLTDRYIDRLLGHEAERGNSGKKAKNKGKHGFVDLIHFNALNGNPCGKLKAEIVNFMVNISRCFRGFCLATGGRVGGV